jgi:hypothetical protein
LPLLIVYSGAAFEGDRGDGVCAGAAAYVIKPDITGLAADGGGQLTGGRWATANAA